jgi:hypothetical protein
MNVLDLGVKEYRETWELQKKLVAQRASNLIPDTVLLVEHPHVITRGRACKEDTMRATSVPVVDVDRGGDVTYHGPGQLVGYPIISLRDRRLGVSPDSAVETGFPSQRAVQKSAESPEGRAVLTLCVGAARGSPGRILSPPPSRATDSLATWVPGNGNPGMGRAGRTLSPPGSLKHGSSGYGPLCDSFR